MGLEEFEAIFGEPRVEWRGTGSGSERDDRFVFHVHAVNSSHLAIRVTDFRFNTWEALRSLPQLEDMRDDIGIGGTWSEFMDYVMASLKSPDVKLILDGHSTSDGVTLTSELMDIKLARREEISFFSSAVNAKLVAQKTKGMPVISVSLTSLAGSAASEAIAKLSLQLFQAFKSTNELYVEEKERSAQLTNAISAERERSENLKRQLEQHSKRQKLQGINSSDTTGVSALSNNGLQSPEKQAARDTGSTKVASRVVPAYRRARVRGVLLQDTEDTDDNKKQ